MNGESVFGWLKVAAVAVAIFAIYYATKKFTTFFTVGAGYNNPLKKGGDSIISLATGRDETVGGWLNDLLDSNSKKVAALSKPLSQSVKSIKISDNYVGDFGIDLNAGSYDEGTQRMLSLPPII